MKILEDCQADADAHEAKHKELEVPSNGSGCTRIIRTALKC